MCPLHHKLFFAPGLLASICCIGTSAMFSSTPWSHRDWFLKFFCFWKIVFGLTLSDPSLDIFQREWSYVLCSRSFTVRGGGGGVSALMCFKFPLQYLFSPLGVSVSYISFKHDLPPGNGFDWRDTSGYFSISVTRVSTSISPQRGVATSPGTWYLVRDSSCCRRRRHCVILTFGVSWWP